VVVDEPPPAAVALPCFSKSAAHNAAPTVLVKAKKMLAMGIVSRRVAGTPKLFLQSDVSGCIHVIVIGEVK